MGIHVSVCNVMGIINYTRNCQCVSYTCRCQCLDLTLWQPSCSGKICSHICKSVALCSCVNYYGFIGGNLGKNVLMPS